MKHILNEPYFYDSYYVFNKSSLIIIIVSNFLRLCDKKFSGNACFCQDYQGADSEVTVEKTKPSSSICGPCYYVQRGSFNCKQGELSQKMAEHSSIKEKSLVHEIFSAQPRLFLTYYYHLLLLLLLLLTNVLSD